MIEHQARPMADYADADMGKSERVLTARVTEAVQYRRMNKGK